MFGGLPSTHVRSGEIKGTPGDCGRFQLSGRQAPVSTLRKWNRPANDFDTWARMLQSRQTSRQDSRTCNILLFPELSTIRNSDRIGSGGNQPPRRDAIPPDKRASAPPRISKRQISSCGWTKHRFQLLHCFGERDIDVQQTEAANRATEIGTHPKLRKGP